jgi:hypothetical protein
VLGVWEMSKLDDIVGAYMVDVDLHGFIAEEEVPPCKREIKTLILELVGEDEPIVDRASKYDTAYKDGRNNLRAELRIKVNAL